MEYQLRESHFLVYVRNVVEAKLMGFLLIHVLLALFLPISHVLLFLIVWFDDLERLQEIKFFELIENIHNNILHLLLEMLYHRFFIIFSFDFLVVKKPIVCLKILFVLQSVFEMCVEDFFQKGILLWQVIFEEFFSRVKVGLVECFLLLFFEIHTLDDHRWEPLKIN